jgi:hypothetical protein
MPFGNLVKLLSRFFKVILDYLFLKFSTIVCALNNILIIYLSVCSRKQFSNMDSTCNCMEHNGKKE